MEVRVRTVTIPVLSVTKIDVLSVDKLEPSRSADVHFSPNEWICTTRFLGSGEARMFGYEIIPKEELSKIRILERKLLARWKE